MQVLLSFATGPIYLSQTAQYQGLVTNLLFSLECELHLGVLLFYFALGLRFCAASLFDFRSSGSELFHLLAQTLTFCYDLLMRFLQLVELRLVGREFLACALARVCLENRALTSFKPTST